VRVVSGGQTGVDQAALRAARAAGFETGGFAPQGWATEAGPAPWLAEYGLVECRVGGYPARTFENVRVADATLWIGPAGSPG
jgi:predicted Rossmann-fold nucleotide-binding protein